MKKILYQLYVIYLILVTAASIFLPIDNGFSVEYVLLGIQAILVFIYLIVLIRKNEQQKKYHGEFSLAIVVMFIGILYYATLHILVIALSAVILAGWFYFGNKNQG